LRRAAAASALAALPAGIRDALAIPAHTRTGTIKDVGHVVILMQENRSFDHYFGTLRGVRGFGDPRPAILPNGKPVWFQPSAAHRDGHVLPFHMDTRGTRAQCVESLDHSWKGSQDVWKNHDAWVTAKGAMTMGHFTRDDIPFYHALADAFTICDAYHCSIFGPTNPNRLFLFTGTNGLSIGNDGLQAIENPEEETNGTADPAKDDLSFKPLAWPTYAERLQAAGIDWRVYQEYDNYGDNGLSYFANFRGAAAASEIGKRARDWAKGSTAENAADSRGEYMIAEFAADVAADRLPQVSWIVAPYIMCEHPAASPGYGEAFVSGLLTALAANPSVWAKTVFILNYDENDGFFDHVPPPVPAIAEGTGMSTVDVAAEIYKGVPVGLGPRVPMLVVSPWTRGGWVNSQLFDHTSVIRFLELRFGVVEPQISPWRRAVCGDLASVFDFAQGNANPPSLPATINAIADTDQSCTRHYPKVPQSQSVPLQEPGQRPARALPYDIIVSGWLIHSTGRYRLQFDNVGAVCAVLTVYARDDSAGPWSYTVEPGKILFDDLPLVDERYAFSVHGPNGFLREYGGAMRGAACNLETSARFVPADDAIVLQFLNRGDSSVAIATSNAYSTEGQRTHSIAPAARLEDRWPIASSAHWYDIAVTAPTDENFRRRFAGHFETGQPSLSDPKLGPTKV
jgi:phospholipase C